MGINFKAFIKDITTRQQKKRDGIPANMIMKRKYPYAQTSKNYNKRYKEIQKLVDAGEIKAAVQRATKLGKQFKDLNYNQDGSPK